MKQSISAQGPRVAYFCMEFGLDEKLPIYSGGLGVLAGDTMKAAKDAEVPLVGIGIFWNQGYTIQTLGKDGRVVDGNRVTTREGLEPTGIEFNLEIRGKRIAVTALKCELFGSAPLYLLEPVNEADRWLTRRLYGGNDDDRVAQEVLLGVGGVRLLRALGHHVDVYHFNEGHAAFAGLELIREQMSAGLEFFAAWKSVRSKVVFTTHTPVVAGNEVHPISRLFEQGADIGCFTRDQLARIGGDPFGMTVAGLRLSRIANGVAQLHGETSRKMWAHIRHASPIVAITNGVHQGTWQDARIRNSYADGLWDAHQDLKWELIDEVERRTGVKLAVDKLLVGFARRAATYKRADLIFGDSGRLEPLLKSGKLQLVFSGKAHPKDLPGKAVIERIAAMTKRYPQSVVFLQNYDMELGRILTRGADVWLNNPRRPMEASGTSGMKAAMNGVLNCSVLDGWWPEGCEHGVTGWQIGGGYEGEDQDAHDQEDLIRVLTQEVVPTYYEQPHRWRQMMRCSIEMSEQKFSAARMLSEYYSKLYPSGSGMTSFDGIERSVMTSEPKLSASAAL